jgi:hypothetical protein
MLTLLTGSDGCLEVSPRKTDPHLMALLDLEAVVPSQVWEGLPTDQFLGAVRWHPLEFGNFGADPRSLLLKDRHHPFITHMLGNTDLQISSKD